MNKKLEAKRKGIHDALDLLLDAADANGNLSDFDLVLRYHEVDEDDTTRQQLDIFTASIVNNELDEAHLHQENYAGGELVQINHHEIK